MLSPQDPSRLLHDDVNGLQHLPLALCLGLGLITAIFVLVEASLGMS